MERNSKPTTIVPSPTTAENPFACLQFNNCPSVCEHFNFTDYNLSWIGYCSQNSTRVDGLDINPYSTVKVAIVAVIAGFVSLVTVGGNLVVLLSFFLERTIRQSSNYFIASLAVSDLLIGSVSMPFYTLYLLTGQNWPLGQMVCDLWLSIDYTVCMTSIYTVFCITVDRFCSVKLPAKYRKWRTDGNVFIIIGVTWFVPAVVFFTSIIGWQYFVGKRTVPEDKCYVQYMESAVFNVVLQIGYFWTTLVLMCVLYTGIYQVALGLQRKSNQKQKKTSTLVSIAGQTVTTTIGIGISVRPQKVADKPNKEVVDGVATSASSPDAAAGISRRPMLSRCRSEDRSSVMYSSDETTGSSDDDTVKSKTKKDAKCFAGCFKNTCTSRRTKSAAKVKQSTARNPDKKKKSDSVLTWLRLSSAFKRDRNKRRCFTYSSLEFRKGTALATYSAVGLPDDINDTDNHRRGGNSGNTQPPIASPVWIRRLQRQKAVDVGESENGCCSNNRNNTTAPSTETLCTKASPTVSKDHKMSRQRLISQRTLSSPDCGSEDVSSPRGVVPGVVGNTHATDGDIVHHGTPGVPHDTTNATFNHCTAGVTHDTAGAVGTSQVAANDVGVPAASHFCKSKNLKRLASNKRFRPEFSLSSAARCAKRQFSKSDGSSLDSLRNSFKSESSLSRKASKKRENRAKKALRTITIILGAFVICWTPWHVLSLIIGFCSDCVDSTMYDISYWLCYLNSPLNPFCYACANPQFKKIFVRIFKLDWHRT